LQNSSVFFHVPGFRLRLSVLDDELKLAFAKLDSIAVFENGGQNLGSIDEDVVRTGEISNSEPLIVELERGVFRRNRSIVELDLHSGRAADDGALPIEFEFSPRGGTARDRDTGPMLF